MTDAAAGSATAATVGADDVADLYAAQAARLRQIVGATVRASDPVVEDACQFAWSRLVDHRETVRRETAFGWLATTAVREAVRLIHRQRRELSLEALVDESAPPRPRARPSRRRALATPTEELVDQRARLASISTLPRRQQRLVWLQGLGLSYEEMADHEHATRRTVERQLLRAKKALREAA
jgi:RNA polymerase sigma factor (sigma-70 family)